MPGKKESSPKPDADKAREMIELPWEAGPALDAETERALEIRKAAAEIMGALKRALELAEADERWAAALGPDFEQAARDVVGAVAAGIAFGYPDHTTTLAPILEDRRRAEWVRACEWHLDTLEGHRALFSWPAFREDALRLCTWLCRVHPNADALTPEHVADALDATKRSRAKPENKPLGFAARLAVAVEAWGYTDWQRAYNALGRHYGKKK